LSVRDGPLSLRIGPEQTELAQTGGVDRRDSDTSTECGRSRGRVTRAAALAVLACLCFWLSFNA